MNVPVYQLSLSAADEEEDSTAKLPGRTDGAASGDSGTTVSRAASSMATGGNNSAFIAGGAPNPILWRSEGF